MKSTTLIFLTVSCLIPTSLRAVPPRETAPSNIKSVEAERDRGAGRIVDPQTHELDRMRDTRPEFDQLLDERDRQLRIDQQVKQQSRNPVVGNPSVTPAPTTEPSILSEIVGSNMQLFVAQSERDLAAAKQDSERQLSDAKAQRDRELIDAEAVPGPDIREQRLADARKRYDANCDHIIDAYRRRRSEILGWPTTQSTPTTTPTTKPGKFE